MTAAPCTLSRHQSSRHQPRPHSLGGDATEPARTCSIYYIQAQLGRQDYGARRLLTYLMLLARDHDFPAPLPVTVRRRCPDSGQIMVQLATTPCLASRWLRAAVDTWLDDFLPPATTAALDAAAQRAAALEMDDAATSLQLIQGGRK